MVREMTPLHDDPKVIMTGEPTERGGMFLMGPTDRKAYTAWRIEALALIRKARYNGLIYVPEFRDATRARDFGGTECVRWEWGAIQHATVVLCWCCWRKEGAPGLGSTTRHEVAFEMALRPRNVIIGIDKDSDSTSWLKVHASRLGIPLYSSLEQLCNSASVLHSVRTSSPRLLPHGQR